MLPLLLILLATTSAKENCIALALSGSGDKGAF